MSKNNGLAYRLLLSFMAVLVISYSSSAFLQDGSGVIREIRPSLGHPGETITITLQAQINGNYSYYELEENVPKGWAVVNDGGGSTPDPKKLKWIVVDDLAGAKGAIFTYLLKPSIAGNYSFSGIYYIAGMPTEENINGVRSIAVQNKQADLADAADRLSEKGFFSPMLSWLGGGDQMECSGISRVVFEMVFTVLGLMLIGFVIILFELRKLTKLLGEEKQDIQRFELDLDKLEKGNAKKPSTELIDYIRNALENGLTEDQVEASLIQAGWGKKHITDIFASLKK
jgi:hypothetical protein